MQKIEITKICDNVLKITEKYDIMDLSKGFGKKSIANKHRKKVRISAFADDI